MSCINDILPAAVPHHAQRLESRRVLQLPREKAMIGKRRPAYRARSCARQILARIKGHYKPGDRLPAEAVLARHYGVSLGTIRQALADLRQQGWVQTVPRSGNFVSTTGGQTRGRIGFLSCMASEEYRHAEWLRTFFSGMAVEAAERGRTIHTIRTGFDRHDVIRALGEADLSAYDAMILFWIYDPQLLEPISRHIPVVAVEFIKDTEHISCVDYDHVKAVQAAVRYLVQLGHERIGFLGPSHVLLQQSESHSPRYETYVKTLRDNGLPWSNSWTFNIIEYADLTVALDRMLSKPGADRPTALLTQMATWPTIYELTARGLHVGRDISVVGLEYLPSWQSWLAENRWRAGRGTRGMVTDPLQVDCLRGPGQAVQRMVPTVTLLDAVELGRAAVQEVERRWANPDTPPQHRFLPVDLWLGNTTGPPADRMDSTG